VWSLAESTGLDDVITPTIPCAGRIRHIHRLENTRLRPPVGAEDCQSSFTTFVTSSPRRHLDSVVSQCRWKNVDPVVAVNGGVSQKVWRGIYLNRAAHTRQTNTHIPNRNNGRRTTRNPATGCRGQGSTHRSCYWREDFQERTQAPPEAAREGREEEGEGSGTTRATQEGEEGRRRGT